MIGKYFLSHKLLEIEEIGISELSKSPIYSKVISSSYLKRHILSMDENRMFVALCFPNVYVEFSKNLFCLNYRLFLAFSSQLHIMETEKKSDWKTKGF